MNSFDIDYAAGLWDACEPPFLSLYQPTYRRHPENQQDPIRFRNLVKALRESLLQKYPGHDVQPLLDPFLALADDRDFWNHSLDGLAVLGAKGLFRVYRLHRRVAELVAVSDSFQTKPLMRILQSADRYQVLGLNRHQVRLFEGNRDVLDEVQLATGVPQTMTEALGTELTEPHQTVAAYGGAGGANSAMHHGHGGKTSEIEIDDERFFRAVDRGILEHHSRPSALPLILATLPEHRQLFHQVSHNPFLIKEGIDINPDEISNDDLRRRAWQVIEPHYLARLTVLGEEFSSARSRDLGHEELAHVAKAVVAGRVATLLIDAGREISGRFDTVTGDIELDDSANPEVDDLLEDLGSLALKMGGKVVMIPTELMPTKTGIAAIYRY